MITHTITVTNDPNEIKMNQAQWPNQKLEIQ